MKKWLTPGAGVLAAVATIAVVVVVVASPFDSDDNSARTTADANSGGARCPNDAPSCPNPNTVANEGICAAEADAADCDDTPGDSLNMCIAGAEDCDDTVVSNPGDPVSNEANDAVASEAAVLALAARLNIDPETIAVVSSEPTEWPDACLGVEKPDTLCAQVITPGYKVILEHNGTQYEYHTDLSGLAIAAN